MAAPVLTINDSFPGKQQHSRSKTKTQSNNMNTGSQTSPTRIFLFFKCIYLFSFFYNSGHSHTIKDINNKSILGTQEEETGLGCLCSGGRGDARKRHSISCQPPNRKWSTETSTPDPQFFGTWVLTRTLLGKQNSPSLCEYLISKPVVGSWVAQVLWLYSGKTVISKLVKTGSKLYSLLY